LLNQNKHYRVILSGRKSIQLIIDKLVFVISLPLFFLIILCDGLFSCLFYKLLMKMSPDINYI
ncbi:hypothetical protein ACFQ5V_27825, partial [Bacillus thuringiensis]